MDHPPSVLIRAVEPGRFFFIISGNIDPDEVLASKDALREALRNGTDRPDLAIGDILQTTDYRCVTLIVCRARVDDDEVGRVSGW